MRSIALNFIIALTLLTFVFSNQDNYGNPSLSSQGYIPNQQRTEENIYNEKQQQQQTAHHQPPGYSQGTMPPPGYSTPNQLYNSPTSQNQPMNMYMGGQQQQQQRTIDPNSMAGYQRSKFPGGSYSTGNYPSQPSSYGRIQQQQQQPQEGGLFSKLKNSIFAASSAISESLSLNPVDDGRIQSLPPPPGGGGGYYQRAGSPHVPPVSSIQQQQQSPSSMVGRPLYPPPPPTAGSSSSIGGSFTPPGMRSYPGSQMTILPQQSSHQSVPQEDNQAGGGGGLFGKIKNLFTGDILGSDTTIGGGSQAPPPPGSFRFPSSGSSSSSSMYSQPPPPPPGAVQQRPGFRSSSGDMNVFPPQQSYNPSRSLYDSSSSDGSSGKENINLNPFGGPISPPPPGQGSPELSPQHFPGFPTPTQQQQQQNDIFNAYTKDINTLSQPQPKPQQIVDPSYSSSSSIEPSHPSHIATSSIQQQQHLQYDRIPPLSSQQQQQQQHMYGSQQQPQQPQGPGGYLSPVYGIQGPGQGQLYPPIFIPPPEPIDPLAQIPADPQVFSYDGTTYIIIIYIYILTFLKCNNIFLYTYHMY